MAETVVPGLERRLKAHLLGEVNFDAFTRGRYATDASHYQIMPVGVVAPRSMKEAEHALALAREEGVSVLPRGAGTSQSGQTVNSSLVIDCSKYLDHVLALDVPGQRCTVEPGIVLDELNRRLRPHGLWFPVDISTASRATIGGMVGNNSCGARSLRYGNTRENVLSIDAVLADGASAHFGPAARDLSDLPRQSPLVPLARDLLALAAREADEIETNFPKVQRRVGGYNLDALVPGRNDLNLAHILVGSEGTLAFSTKIELKLAPLLGRRGVGACHFGSFARAMDAAQHIVKLGPIAVELVDRTMLGLARDIAMFKPTIDAVVRGDPEAILFVEFAEEDQYENLRRLIRLKELMGDLGLGWDKTGAKWGGVVDVFDARLQAAITEMRTAGLNIMMSMKEEGKPISFVEDCAVPLEHLADYTSRLTDIFEKHGTRGTWYAHASVGCLHVRPVLNLRLEHDVKAMRAIAEEAFDMVRAYKGSHSGEHGDGIVRSEFHEKMFGPELVRAFEEVKRSFDPDDRFNPGKIVHAPKFDDRTLFRYGPDYHAEKIDARLDWSAYPGAGGGFQGAVEMCNNNGACRALAGGVMCPSYRVTRDERDVTRGRANTLRLAIIRPARSRRADLGRDGADAQALRLLQGLPARVPDRRRHGAHEDRGAGGARRQARALAARPAGRISAALCAARRQMARSRQPAQRPAAVAAMVGKIRRPERAQEPAALAQRCVARAGASARRRQCARGRVLRRHLQPLFRAGEHRGRARRAHRRRLRRSSAEARGRQHASALLRAHFPGGRAGRRGAARGRALRRRAFAIARARHAGRGARAELHSRFPRRASGAAQERRRAGAGCKRAAVRGISGAGGGRRARLDLPLKPVAKRALLHGHCHQKSFGAMGAAEAVLALVPELAVETVESSCCGMAGAFGYGADTIDVSLKMAELSLLPAVRKAEADTLVLADGTSCRHQIKDGSGRDALHVARVLAMSLNPSGAGAGAWPA